MSRPLRLEFKPLVVVQGPFPIKLDTTIIRERLKAAEQLVKEMRDA